MNSTSVKSGVAPSSGPAASAATGNYPLARLLQLILLLQAERCPNARQLAEACEVSRRTIYRDFSTLGAAGIVVNYIPDRQGYQLAKNVFLQPTRLLEKEALALLLISRCWDGAAGADLLRHARGAVDKVIQGLPQELRASLANGAELLPDGSEIEELVGKEAVLLDSVLDAMTRRRQIRIWYREGGRTDAEVGTTKMSLYRLARLDGRWTLVGRSSVDRGVVTLPLPWVEKIEATTDAYTLPPRFQLRRFLESTHARASRDAHREIVLRLRGGLSGRIDDLPWKGPRRLVSSGAGVAELAVEVETLENLAPVVLSFGDDLEVVGPRELREEVGRLAERIARRHLDIAAEGSRKPTDDVPAPFGGLGG
jgi:predicted DNA-binding transcriptional regulator YafY